MDTFKIRFQKVTFVALFSLVSLSAKAIDGVDVARKIDAEITKSKINREQLGLFIYSDQGATVFDLNGDKLMTPASLTKLLTAVSAIEKFSAGQKFVTQLMSPGEVKKESLEGSLYLKGFGDPSFVSEKMWYLVNELTRTGIKEITGDIIIDDSFFDKERFDSGRDPSRVNRAYDSPIGAASFNWNSVNIFIRPAAKAGETAQVIADPISRYIKLINSVKTTKNGDASFVIDRIDGASGDTIKISGNIGVNSPEIVKYVSVSRPDIWVGHHLIEFLKQRQIDVKGSIKVGQASDSMRVLAKVEGAPLYEVLSDMNKFSNNFVAEMLTKQLGAQKGVRPATMASGLQVINEVLQKYGWSSNDYKLQSPSGFSQDNKMKPKKLAELLLKVRKTLRLAPEVMASLPLAGVDGTLKSRMKGTSAEQNVRGKTGLLTGAIGLAGYAGTPAGETLSYVFIYNGPESNQKIWPLFDTIAARLVE